MKLQKCSPSFFDARDAIIQADEILTGGENFCDLWAGFAEKGLGPNAQVVDRTPWGGGIRTNVSRSSLIMLAIYAEQITDLTSVLGFRRSFGLQAREGP